MIKRLWLVPLIYDFNHLEHQLDGLLPMPLLRSELFLDLNVRNLLFRVDLLLIELLELSDGLQHLGRGEDLVAYS